MKKLKRVMQLILLLSFSFLIIPIGTNADSKLPISVNTILPENQHNKKVTYYDLRMKPSQQQELDFELINPTNKKETIKLEIKDAITNDVGVIDYMGKEDDYQRDPSLKYALSDMASVPKEVTVAPKSREIVKIKLDMPEEKLDGVVIGAIQVSRADEKAEKDSEGVTLKSVAAYRVGIKLSESDEDIKAKLELVDAFPDHTNQKNVIKGNLRNETPILLEKVKYDAQVTKRGQKKVLHKSSAVDYRFAPNSTFNFDVDWEGTRFEKGEYTYYLQAISEETGQTWKWEKDFSISEEEAERLNDSAVLMDQSKGKSIWIIVCVVLIFILAIFFLYYKKIVKNKHNKSKKKIIKNNRKKSKHKK